MTSGKGFCLLWQSRDQCEKAGRKGEELHLHINLVIGTNAEQNGNSTAIVLNLLVKKNFQISSKISSFQRNEKHNDRLNIKLFWAYFKLATEEQYRISVSVISKRLSKCALKFQPRMTDLLFPQ